MRSTTHCAKHPAIGRHSLLTVRLVWDASDMESLCRSALMVSSQVHLDATMRRIYEAMLDLDSEQHRMQQLGVKVGRITCAPPSSSCHLFHPVRGRLQTGGPTGCTELKNCFST